MEDLDKPTQRDTWIELHIVDSVSLPNKMGVIFLC